MKRNENSFWKQKREFIILGSMIVLSFICMRLDHVSSVQWIKNQAQAVSGILFNSFSFFPRLLSIQQQNRQLLKEVGDLYLEKTKYQEAIFENKRLRSLLNFQEATRYHCLAAEVTGYNPSNLQGQVHLNIGSQSGCEKNQVLINEKGLVGRILNTNLFSSTGQLITDPNFRVSAKVQRSSVLGIVRWLYGNMCLLEGVSIRSDVQIGDVIVTSGYSEIYPPGLPIGRVVKIKETSEALFKHVAVHTEVDFGSIEEVLVLQPKPEDI